MDKSMTTKTMTLNDEVNRLNLDFPTNKHEDWLYYVEQAVFSPCELSNYLFFCKKNKTGINTCIKNKNRT